MNATLMLISAGPELKVISTMSVGTGSSSQVFQVIVKFTGHIVHIDLVAVEKHNSNIRVGNTPDVLTDAGKTVSSLFRVQPLI